MAKAQFHRNQKVWVATVGTWAVIEKVIPIWTRGFDEPVKITYDVGLGREFSAGELRAEDLTEDPASEADGKWRLLRAHNKWQQPEDCAHHPYPGTYPVVVTDPQDWGGWRVPGAEYDRDPRKIEAQARLIASAPKLLNLARELRQFVSESPDDAPAELQALAKRCDVVLRHVLESPAPPLGVEGAADAPAEPDADAHAA